MADTEPTTAFSPDDAVTVTSPKPTEPPSKGIFQLGEFGAGDRVDIVNLTNPEYTDYGTAYLDVPTLELSALGANAEIIGNWNSAPGFSGVTAWHDLGQGGRTVKALVSRRGYLFPLGHRAVVTNYFERVIALDPTSPIPVAYLQKRTVMRVIEPIKKYGPSTVGEPWTIATGGATDWPFTQVRMVTLKTPDLDAIATTGGNPIQFLLDLSDHDAHQAIWPTYDNFTQDVQWTFVATDLAGRDVTFTMPLVFVYAGEGSHGTPYPSSEFKIGDFTDRLASAYHAHAGHKRYSDVGGVQVKFAPEAGGVVGGTTHATNAIMIGAATSSLDYNPPVNPHSPGENALLAAIQPNFYPVLRRAKIRIHAAEVLTGQDQDIPAGDNLLPIASGVEVNFYPEYVSGDLNAYGSPGNGGNAGAVYLAISGDFNLNLPANKVGGIGTPSTTLSGLSATTGAVGGTLSSFAQKAPHTDIADYFPPSLDPQLLGGLKLSDILDPSAFNMPNIGSSSLSNAASGLGGLLSEVPPGGVDAVLADVTTGTDPSTGAHTVTYTLNTGLTPYPTSDPIFVPDSDSGMLSMTTTVEASLDGSSPTYTSNGSIDPFSIKLIDSESLYILLLHFDTVTFSGGSGQSTQVSVNLDNVSFEGCLEFVNTLEQFLESLGAGGLAIHIEPTQVALGLSFSLPDIQTGVFALSGISFQIGVTIPFLSGKAIATFAFASSDNPFTLTYSCFGGGGFVALGVGFGGLQTLQAQFEVEAQAAIGIVVASGSVTLSIGIYYSYTSAGGADLSGFVQLSGQVELLGIITVSITMNISITWEITAGAVQGTASMSIGISICGFGVSVGVTVTKTFGGATSSSSSVSPSSDTAGGDGYELDAFTVPVEPTHLHLLAPPIFRTTPITFSELISKSDWDTYCDAFRT